MYCCPQSTFASLTFDIIGDDAATVYFSVDQFSGIVRVASDLTATTDSVYYVSMAFVIVVITDGFYTA